MQFGGMQVNLLDLYQIEQLLFDNEFQISHLQQLLLDCVIFCKWLLLKKTTFSILLNAIL